jgi:hypothetical protein
LASPAFNEHWGAHRAVANWITEFTTIMRENLIALAKDQREGQGRQPEPEAPGTPYMEHTTDFDDSDFPVPASAVEAS